MKTTTNKKQRKKHNQYKNSKIKEMYMYCKTMLEIKGSKLA